MKWVARDGRVIAIEDLDTNHLTNIVKLLWRNKESYKMKLELSTMDQACDAHTEREIFNTPSSYIMFTRPRNEAVFKEAWARRIPLSAKIWDSWKSYLEEYKCE